MFAQRLKLARKQADLSMQEIGGRLSNPLSAQAINQYEKGLMMPTASVLINLSQALGVSPDFLIGGQIDALQGIEFRNRSHIAAKERAQAEVLVLEKIENYLAIESILAIESVADPFDALTNTQPIQRYADIDEKAMEVRRAWDLGAEPIASLSRLLEDWGIKVIEAKMPEGCDGLTCKAHRSGKLPAIEVVLVSSRSPVERKRFHLAYEIGRRVMLNISHSGIHEERVRHKFAAAFLMPSESLRKRVGGQRTDCIFRELVDLKWFYGVPAAAMLMRLREIDCLSQATVTAAFRGYARLWHKEEPHPIQDDKGWGFLEKSRRYEALVWRALGEKLFSPLRAAQLLNCPLSDIEDSLSNQRI